MKVILVSLSLFGFSWASLNCECGKRNAGRIYGGKEIGKNEYPWMVALQGTLITFTFCGGTIVTPWHVVTAAHCVWDIEARDIAIVVGAHDVHDLADSASQRLFVERIVVHPNNENITNVADLALLVTSTEIIYNEFVGPVCMPSGPIGDEMNNQIVKALGWGNYEPGRTNNDKIKNLREVDIEIQSVSSCEGSNGKKICTYTSGKDTCAGDSGGPLLWLDPENSRFTLVGVVSSGPDYCGNSPLPGKNTNVAFFKDWIYQEIRNTKSQAKTCQKINAQAALQLSYYLWSHHFMMKIILVSFLLYGVAWAALNCECGDRYLDSKKSVYPWLVLMQTVYDSATICGGTIVTTRHVITSAYCVKGRVPHDIVLFAGAYDAKDVSDTNIQPIFVDQIVDNKELTEVPDLAVLVTQDEITFNEFVGPACMPTKQPRVDENLNGQMVKIIGWGSYDPSKPSAEKKKKVMKVDLLVTSPIRCNGPKITRICSDSSGGESGDAMVWLDPEINRLTLVGVVAVGSDVLPTSASRSNSVNILFYKNWIWKTIERTVNDPKQARTCQKS